jgi:hypothetical protein
MSNDRANLLEKISPPDPHADTRARAITTTAAASDTISRERWASTMEVCLGSLKGYKAAYSEPEESLLYVPEEQAQEFGGDLNALLWHATPEQKRAWVWVGLPIAFGAET